MSTPQTEEIDETGPAEVSRVEQDLERIAEVTGSRAFSPAEAQNWLDVIDHRARGLYDPGWTEDLTPERVRSAVVELGRIAGYSVVWQHDDGGWHLDVVEPGTEPEASAFELGDRHGYEVAAWQYAVEQGVLDPVASEAPRYDEELAAHPARGRAYRSGLSRGRTRFIDEHLTELGAEPSPITDNGPYASREQAAKQLAAALFGLPVANEQAVKVWVGSQVTQALMLAGVETSDYETYEIEMLPVLVGNEVTQVIAGWVRRAYLSGLEKGRPSEASAS